MERTPVKSSNIAAIAYDPATRILEVEFKSGLIYRYLDVKPPTYEAFSSAKSLGSHLAAHIRPHHKAHPHKDPKPGDPR